MIVRDVTNTRPPDQIAAWLDGLGSFEQIEPAEAAERWGLPIRDAMERLHAMVGGPLEIQAGRVEIYHRVEWTAPSDPRKGMMRYPALREQRVSMLPADGCTLAQAAELWGIGKAAASEAIGGMVRNGMVERRRINWHLWLFVPVKNIRV